MRRRRFLGMGAGLTGAVTGALGLSATTTACGGEAEDGEVVLSLLATEHGQPSESGSTEHYWNEVVAEFQSKHPGIQVDVSVVHPQHASSEITRLMDGGNAPDIAQLSTFADFAEAEQLYPANELLTIPTLADFIPTLAMAGNRGLLQYGLPFASVVTRFFYNKRLFREAGLDPEEPPRTWSALRDAAEALRAADVRTPFALPFGHEDCHMEAAAWMLSGGGALTDTTGNYTIESLENTDTFTWLRDRLVSPGLCGPDGTASERSAAYAGFADGTTGMLLGSPLLISQAEDARIDFGTARIPGLVGPTATPPGEATWLLGFNVNERGEEISTFLNFVYNGASVARFSDRYGYLPVTTPAVEALSVSSSPADRNVMPFVEDLRAAAISPAGKVSWTRVSAMISERIGEAVAPGSDIPTLLSELQGQVELLDQDAPASGATADDEA